jgi:hypothetical protein
MEASAARLYARLGIAVGAALAFATVALCALRAARLSLSLSDSVSRTTERVAVLEGELQSVSGGVRDMLDERRVARLAQIQLDRRLRRTKRARMPRVAEVEDWASSSDEAACRAPAAVQRSPLASVGDPTPSTPVFDALAFPQLDDWTHDRPLSPVTASSLSMA